MNIKTVSLKDYSSLRIGGEGKLVEVETVEQLKEAVMHAKTLGLRVHALGEGTNSYFAEDVSSFLFLKLNLLGFSFEELGDTQVRFTISASENWDEMVQVAVREKLWGIENLSYIPGSVGAAPVQNIGAYGAELSNVLETVSVLDGTDMEVKQLSREDCRFGYRDSIFKYDKGRYIILSITLILSKRGVPIRTYRPLDTLAETARIEEVRELVIKTRAAKLPDWKEYPNAGSFFKNPHVDLPVAENLHMLDQSIPLIQVMGGYKVPAAWLIEHIAEMKGVRKGDLGTWPLQPLVIVNYGTATADDIDAFAGEIVAKVNEKTGVVLEQEVNRVG